MLVEFNLNRRPDVVPERRCMEVSVVPRIGEYVGFVDGAGKVTSVVYFIPDRPAPAHDFWSRVFQSRKRPETKVIVSLAMISLT